MTTIVYVLGFVSGGFFTAWTLSIARLLTVVKAKSAQQVEQ